MGYRHITLNYVPGSGPANLYGQYNHSKYRITVNRRAVPFWRQKVALAHEIWHYLDHENQLELDHYDIHLLGVLTALDNEMKMDEWRNLFKRHRVLDQELADQARGIYDRILELSEHLKLPVSLQIQTRKHRKAYYDKY